MVIEPEPLPDVIRELYAGKWVAILRGKVIAQGDSPEQVLRSAQEIRRKEKFKIIYIPRYDMLQFPPIVYKLVALIPPDIEIYLVGGVVRDAFRDVHSKDIDFIMTGEAIPIAKKIANALGVPFYPLKEELDVARIVLMGPEGERQYLDFSSLRGKTLEEDLMARDFTINAIAVNLREPEKIYDPCQGVKDLLAGEIKVCTNHSLLSDPVRILRAIRQAALFKFKITPETRKLIRQAAEFLPRTSPERQRDELMRIMAGPKPDAALIAMDMLGVLKYVFPEVTELKGIEQSPPHTLNVFDHTIAVVQKLAAVLDVLGPQHDPEGQANNLIYGQLSVRLGRFREKLGEHLKSAITPERSIKSILFFAAMFHDCGKKDTAAVSENGQIHFYKHDIVGSVLTDGRAHFLRLSNDEIHRAVTIVRHHMRPFLLTNTGETPSRRAVYRFFRDTGEVGVDICLLSLADFLGTYGVNVPSSLWANHLETVRVLLEAWWEKPAQEVNPELLFNGSDIIRIFGLDPGPKIGQVLEFLREMQAVGLVQTRAQAVQSIKQFLSEN
jgi:tRNA nucleotidyltransferase/poly(A) polymerase